MSEDINIRGNVAIAGTFNPDPVGPTCTGRLDWDALTEIPQPEYLEISRNIMSALWSSPCPTQSDYRPSIKNTDDIIVALSKGWTYNANEADTMFTFFGDIRAVVDDGRIVGIGTKAPDGTIIRDGRELIAWRNRQWDKTTARRFGYAFVHPIMSNTLN